MDLIKEASRAYKILHELKESGYTIEELVEMLPLLNISKEVLEELAKW